MIYERFKDRLLTLLKAPKQPPDPPAGSRGSVQIFRAAPNFLKYQMVVWGAGFVAGIVGTGSRGLLWRREIFLTYTRIQDIHLSRGVLERWMGLATINIQTAAGSSSAEMAVVGLIEFEQVRDFLYSKMRGARFGETEPTGDGPRPAPGGPASADDEAVELLTDIRDEIRALGKRLKGAGK